MQSSTSYQIASNLSILLVGEQKTGKTGIAAAFPSPYFLDLDLNLDSAVRVMGDKKFFFDRPMFDDKGNRLDDFLVYPRAMDQLKAAAVHPEVKTLVVDSLSTLVIYLTAHILSEVSRIEGKKIETLRIQDYGRLHNLLQKLVVFLRSTGKYVVVTSHQSWDKDEVTGAVRYTLAIPGQMKHNFGSFFNDVWGTMATQGQGGKNKYTIRTRPSGFHVALGTSIRTLPAEVDVTDKKPDEIWALLTPYIGGQKPS